MVFSFVYNNYATRIGYACLNSLSFTRELTTDTTAGQYAIPKRKKMRAHSGAMTQINASKCLLHTLLPILVLFNSWASAGFISPGNSVSVGRSPTLRYLLACAHLAAKPPIFSTHDVYTNDQVSRAVFLFVSA